MPINFDSETNQVNITVPSPTTVTVTQPEALSVTVVEKGLKGDTGVTGATGPQGATGAVGQGVPAGGVERQVIVKQSETDYDTAWEYVEAVYMQVKNDEGSPLTSGTPLYVKGVQGSSILVGKACANNPATMPSTSILFEDLAIGATGEAIAAGLFNKTITGLTGVSIGDIVYVGNNGGLTVTKPTASNELVQNVGIVIQTNGSNIQRMKVSAIGRTNDIPNLASGKFFIGGTTGQISPYTLPIADGSPSQILQTNGSGTVSFADLEALPSGGTTGQALVKIDGTDYNVQWADIAVDVQYHDRYQSQSATLRSGATATTEIYYSAIADGDGYAESASSDTPTSGYDIQRKLYYAEEGFADPDTGTWTQFTAIADNTSFATAKATLLEYLKARTGGTVPISLKMTWEEVVQAPAFTGLLNESYGSGAAAAYGTRRLNGNYSGDCMTIRRADGATLGVGFVGEDIDESAITTFCSGSTCTVQVWHDQSGNGNDATQTTPANQPTIYTGGALVKDGGRLALDFDGSNDFFNTSFNQGTLTGFLYSAVVAPTTTTALQSIVDLRDANDDGTRVLLINNGTVFTSTDAADSSVAYTARQQLITGEYDGTNLTTYIDGTGGTSVSGTDTTATANALIGVQLGAASFFMNGTMQELVFYFSDKSTDRTSIEGNISAYYQSAKLLNEQYGEGAAAAYSVRLLDRDYTGSAVQLERTSDNSFQDIGFDVNGDLDESAITTFCTGTTCKVRTWYDQSGNANNAVQTDHTKQPTIYTGGAIVKENGRVAVDFDGTDDELTSTTVPFSGTTHRTSFTVSNADTATSDDIIYGIDGGNASAPTGELWQLTSETQLRVSGRIAFNNSAQTIHSLGTLIFNGTTVDDANFYLNGSLTTQGTSTGATINTGSTNFGIGTTVVSSINYDGKQQELIFYASDKSTDRTSIESNIGDYFTQNTPLLDTYSGAAAAYSLRKLRTAYTGAAIEVYNGTSYQDIGFNVFGELDTVSLAAFCGGNNGFVSKWYDQSGNANDATQTNTANQPKIYDGTTGVVTENGKPMIQTASQKYLNTNVDDGVKMYTVASVDQTSMLAEWRTPDGSGAVSQGFLMAAQSGSTASFYDNTTLTVNAIRKNGSTYAFASKTRGDIYTDFFGQHLGYFDVTTARNDISLGYQYNSATFPMYNTQELIIYPSSSTHTPSNIEDNINTFYSIY